MPSYLVQFAQFHEDFRLPELESLAQLENVTYTFAKDTYSLKNPFLVIELQSDTDAEKLVKRAILLKNIYELWGVGETYEKLHERVKETRDRWDAFKEASFKFTVTAFGSTVAAQEQLKIFNSFSYMGFRGPIDLKKPDVEFGILEDFGTAVPEGNNPPSLKRIFMGRLVASGSRDLVNTYNLKKRKYLGTTSMDAELSLVMANQALAAPGKLVYDPFVGTGSFLFTCAHFGAYTLGSDIDGRQIRGKGGRSVHSNVEQYKLQGKVLDTLVFDVCHHPWRTNSWLDAIVTAPYGVRVGAKKLGRKDNSKPYLTEKSSEGTPVQAQEDRYPPTKPYEMSDVLVDLLAFAANHLRVGGRLVYWLPTVVDEYAVDDIPKHLCMRLISNSEQNFGQWARRLITMEKVCEMTESMTATVTDKAPGMRLDEQDVNTQAVARENEGKKRPGHYGFRDKYFQFGRQTPEKKE